MSPTDFASWLLLPPAGRRALIMGVVNVTPDSFSDGGRFLDPGLAVDHARRLIDEGADLLDLGGESTRPGSQPVDADEQIRRLVPVVQGIRNISDIAISIDTRLADVARITLDAGATLINDIAAGRDDAALLPLVAERGCPIVLMHMLGTPATMQHEPEYADVVEEVNGFLHERAAVAEAAGVKRENILLDPGIGFGKTIRHNLLLLRHLPILTQGGYPLLVGTSRKRFLGTITGETEPAARVFGTAGSVAWSVMNGADIVRVHDVKAMRQVLDVIEAIRLAE